MLFSQRSGPVNAFGGLGIEGGFQQTRFDQHLFGGFVQTLDQHIHTHHFLFGSDHNDLAGARVGHYFAAPGVGEGIGDGRHDVRRQSVLELVNLRDQRRGRRRVFFRDAGNLAFRVLNELQVVVGEQRFEGLRRRDVFPANRDTRLWRHFAIRPDLAETDLGIEHVIQGGHTREVADRVGQLRLIHDDDGNNRAWLGGAGGSQHRSRRCFCGWRGRFRCRGGRIRRGRLRGRRRIRGRGRCGIARRRRRSRSIGLSGPRQTRAEEHSQNDSDEFQFHVISTVPTLAGNWQSQIFHSSVFQQSQCQQIPKRRPDAHGARKTTIGQCVVHH